MRLARMCCCFQSRPRIAVKSDDSNLWDDILAFSEKQQQHIFALSLIMSTEVDESAPDQIPTPAVTKTKKASGNKAKPVVSASPAKKKKKKSKGPGKYSQLVTDAIRTLGEKNGSSLFKIYNEAKKVSWFDQQNGRMYLRYSIRALLLNDTLVQVKGLGANGSFKLNKKKFEKKTKKSAAKATKKTEKPKKAVTKKVSAKKSAKKSSVKKKTTKKTGVKKVAAKPKKAAAKKPKVAVKKATKAKKTK